MQEGEPITRVPPHQYLGVVDCYAILVVPRAEDPSPWWAQFRMVDHEILRYLERVLKEMDSDSGDLY